MEKLRPDNIKTFETPYLEEIKKRCRILVKEAIKREDFDQYEKNNQDIDKIEEELAERYQSKTLFDD